MSRNIGIIFLFAAIVSACGSIGEKHPATPQANDQVGVLWELYDRRLTEYKALTAAAGGLPSVTDCDGTVWAGAAAAGGAPVNMNAFEYAPGEIHRRPQASGECYPAGSSSTESRDDQVLYMTAAFSAGDVGALQRLAAYGEANSWYMGEPHSLELTYLGPNLEGILGRALVKLGGDGGNFAANAYSAIPIAELPGLKDYQKHIEVEEILLSTAVSGQADGWELALLSWLVSDVPQDPLFQAARGIYSGDFGDAVRLLLDPETPVPTYVRGDSPDAFFRAYWLRAAKVVLNQYPR